VEEWERWFSEAVWDLETAEILHSARRYNAAVFYAQQAAEKAAKVCFTSSRGGRGGTALGSCCSTGVSQTRICFTVPGSWTCTIYLADIQTPTPLARPTRSTTRG